MITVLIADDEAPARRKVRSLLAHAADIQVVGEASDGAEAVERIRASRPDVVFLDIQMPKLDGFGVIQEIGAAAMPVVVFTTAYDEHALRAFEVQALDYLLKPFAPSRFRQMLDRVRTRLAGPARPDLADRLAALLEAAAPTPGYLQQIMVDKGHQRQVLLRLDDVDRIVSDGNYLRFVTPAGEFLRRGALADFETRLDPRRFLRINRGEIVRLDAVAEFQPWFHGDYRVTMKDGRVLTWSRRYRAKSGLPR